MKKALALAALVTLATACGTAENSPAKAEQETDKKETPAFNSFAINSKADLPTCDASRSGQLAYAKTEKKFYTCDAAAWAEVEMPIPEPSPVVSEVIRCQNDFATDGVWLIHETVVYSDTSKQVTCSLSGYENKFNVQNSRNYLPSQAGAENHACNLTADLNNSSSGYFEFAKTSATAVSATIKDAGSPDNGKAYSLTCTTTKN